MAGAVRDIVIFDLGGVLIEWDPRHLYRKLFAGDDTAMGHCLTTSAPMNGTAVRMPAVPLPRAPEC